MTDIWKDNIGVDLDTGEITNLDTGEVSQLCIVIKDQGMIGKSNGMLMHR